VLDRDEADGDLAVVEVERPESLPPLQALPVAPETAVLVRDAVWVAVCVGVKRLKLHGQVVRILTGEAREFRMRAVAARPMTGAAHGDGNLLGIGSGGGVRLVRSDRGVTEAERNGACHQH
jgi:hypothetical protein